MTPQIRILQQELARAREQLALQHDTAARSYWLGVVDGLVLVFGTLGVSTLQNPPLNENTPN